MSPTAPSQTGSEVVLAEVIEEFTNRLQTGEPIDVESYIQKHPEHAERLRQLLPALALLDDLGRSVSAVGSGSLAASRDGSLAGTLGDFRIVREVGKGGMGVVYEAEQISLRRRVALKVLPFAATMDPRHLQRFHNEAQAAACLHHTNIVPVFFVGCERGVHFYAMQFIEGQSLAELIAAQRQNALSGGRQPPESSRAESSLGGLTPPAQETQPIAAAITQPASRDAAHHRRIAEWGIQAAQALEYAHDLGIVHRDIKPSNLMIDRAGRLWVTDFGLARTTTGAGLTMTGDVVGTLRYMSPEQALAKHGLVDHRTDIYALGATLYELLTLRPAIDGKDREEILHNLSFEEPSPPRSLDRTIPTDLETIVLKALAREPSERYPTAQEMADDLSRFLENRPIRARRPSCVQIARKWLRRHQAAAWVAGVGLNVVVVILSVSSLLLWRAKERVKFVLSEKETKSRLAEQQADVAEKQRRRAEANFGAVLDGMTMLMKHLDEEEWPQPVRIERVHEALAQHLEGFFQRFVAEGKDDPTNRLQIGWAYQHLGVYYCKRGDLVRAERHYRTALAFHEALATEYPDGPAHVWMYAQSLKRLGTLLHDTSRLEEAHGYFLQAGEQYRRQVQMHPDWRAYHDLAEMLCNCPDVELRDAAEAMRLSSQAIELAPNSDLCWRMLGAALYRIGKAKAAIQALERAMKLCGGECYLDWVFLAMAHWKNGDEEQGRRWFERVAQEMDKKKHPHEDWYRLRAEAATLLGIKEPPTKRNEVSHKKD